MIVRAIDVALIRDRVRPGAARAARDLLVSFRGEGFGGVQCDGQIDAGHGIVVIPLRDAVDLALEAFVVYVGIISLGLGVGKDLIGSVDLRFRVGAGKHAGVLLVRICHAGLGVGEEGTIGGAVGI